MRNFMSIYFRQALNPRWFIWNVVTALIRMLVQEKQERELDPEMALALKGLNRVLLTIHWISTAIFYAKVIRKFRNS